jgi:competence protein ComEC
VAVIPLLPAGPVGWGAKAALSVGGASGIYEARVSDCPVNEAVGRSSHEDEGVAASPHPSSTAGGVAGGVPRRRILALLLVVAAPALAGCLEGAPGDGGLPDGGLDGDADETDPPPNASAFAASEPFPTLAPQGNVTVEQVDVGQGDGLVLHFPDSVVVVDTGPWYGEGETAILDHLQAEGVTDVRAVVVTHPDADHAGGCDEVLEGLDVAFVVHPGSSKDTQTWGECEAAIDDEAAMGLTDDELDPGAHLNLSAHAGTRLLHLDDEGEVNAGSVVLRVDYGDFEAHLTGDMDCQVERRVLDAGHGRDVDLLKVAHHGSSSSTCDPWLDATSPEVATVGVGADNTYGHPHDEVLDRLRDHGVDVYRTDLHGTVDVTSDGSGWDVRTEEEADPEPGDGTGNASGVRIVDVQYDAPGNDNENLSEEWVEVANGRNASVDVAGWSLEDEAGHTYVFPDGNHTVLGPDETVTIRTGSGNDTATDLYWGRDGAVWNNGGDTATLRDAAGAVVDAWSW